MIYLKILTVEDNLAYHDFIHSVYRQLFGDFLSHLAVRDLLFNEDADSLGIVRSGRGGG